MYGFQKNDEVTVVALAEQLPKKAAMYAGQSGVVVAITPMDQIYFTVEFSNGDRAAYLKGELRRKNATE